MNYSFFFASRNLKRNKRRTLILVSSIAIAVMLISLTYNMSISSSIQIKDQVTNGYTGKNQLSKKGFSLTEERLRISRYLRLKDMPQNLPEATPRIYAPVYIAAGSKTVGTMMIGVDPNHEIKLTRIHEGLAAGQLLQDINEKSVVIGKQLAQTLEVKVGDELILLSQGVDGSSANDLFIVKGILNLGSAELEEKFVLAPVGTTREFLSMPDDAFHTLLAKELFSPKLKETYEIMSWEELLPDVNGPLLLFEKFLGILTMALTFVISIGVANTLYVSFNERQSEMESLNILGAKPHWIIVSLFYEVVILLGISLAVGSIFALALNHFFHIYPADLTFLLGGTDFLLGGMKISPIVKVIHHLSSYTKAIVVVGGFYMIASLYPLSNIARQIKK